MPTIDMPMKLAPMDDAPNEPPAVYMRIIPAGMSTIGRNITRRISPIRGGGGRAGGGSRAMSPLGSFGPAARCCVRNT
jgi:hypothetical protein